MDRRNFLAGSMALVAPQKLLHSMGALSVSGFPAPARRDGADARSLTQPHDLLSTTYPRSFLQSKLVPVNEWHPFPKWDERAAWETIPDDIRAASMERAEAAQKEGWRVLLATKFLEFDRNGNRSHFESDRSVSRAKLASLVLGECMEGKGRFVDDIVNGVWLICEESFWGVPAHLPMQKVGVGLPDITEPIIDLFAAETAQLLSWTKYLVGDQLDRVSPLVKKRIVLETERRILKPARDRDDFSWMGLRSDEQDRIKNSNPGMNSAPQIGGVWRIGARLNNWNPWINSNLLVANLILEEDPQLRLNEMARITHSLDAYLNEYFPDAGEEEGPGYYSRSVLGFFECVSTFESATGNSTNILANPFIDAMGRYILNAHICEKNYIDYGDAHVHASPDGYLLYRFGKAVHDEQLEAFGAWCAARQGVTATQASDNRGVGRGATSLSRPLAEILGADEIRKARQEDVLLRDCYYPDLGLVTARVKAGSADGMYFADLAANNGRSHSHNDTGSYIIYQDCQPVAIDVGVEAYTAKTFSSDRYTIWTMQSAYHNLPTIGGVMQHDGAEFKATDRKFSSDDERATYSFNIASAYPKEAGVKSWVRTVTLDRIQDRITVEEDFELERAVPVSLSVMTPRIAIVNSAGNINMKPADGTGKPCLLNYDAAALDSKVETIPLTDPGLRESWGDHVYRVLLSSKQPAASGRWTYEFRSA